MVVIVVLADLSSCLCRPVEVNPREEAHVHHVRKLRRHGKNQLSLLNRNSASMVSHRLVRPESQACKTNRREATRPKSFVGGGSNGMLQEAFSDRNQVSATLPREMSGWCSVFKKHGIGTRAPGLEQPPSCTRNQTVQGVMGVPNAAASRDPCGAKVITCQEKDLSEH